MNIIIALIVGFMIVLLSFFTITLSWIIYILSIIILYIFSSVLNQWYETATIELHYKNLKLFSQDLLISTKIIIISGIIVSVITFYKGYFLGILFGAVSLMILVNIRKKIDSFILKKEVRKQLIKEDIIPLLIDNFNTVTLFIDKLRKEDKRKNTKLKSLYLELTIAYIFSIIKAAEILDNNMLRKIMEISTKAAFEYLSKKYKSINSEHFFEICSKRVAQYNDILENGIPENIVIILGEALSKNINEDKSNGFDSIPFGIWFSSNLIALKKFYLDITKENKN